MDPSFHIEFPPESSKRSRVSGSNAPELDRRRSGVIKSLWVFGAEKHRRLLEERGIAEESDSTRRRLGKNREKSVTVVVRTPWNLEAEVAILYELFLHWRVPAPFWRLLGLTEHLRIDYSLLVPQFASPIVVPLDVNEPTIELSQAKPKRYLKLAWNGVRVIRVFEKLAAIAENKTNGIDFDFQYSQVLPLLYVSFSRHITDGLLTVDYKLDEWSRVIELNRENRSFNSALRFVRNTPSQAAETLARAVEGWIREGISRQENIVEQNSKGDFPHEGEIAFRILNEWRAFRNVLIGCESQPAAQGYSQVPWVLLPFSEVIQNPQRRICSLPPFPPPDSSHHSRTSLPSNRQNVTQQPSATFAVIGGDPTGAPTEYVPEADPVRRRGLRDRLFRKKRTEEM